MTDDDLSLEEIAKLRAEGSEKPKHIQNSLWEGPKDLRFKYHPICYLMALGMRSNDIAKELGLSQTVVQQLVQKERIKIEITDLERRYANHDIRGKIQSILPKTVEVLETIMDDENNPANARISAANILQDRGLGKPRQEIDMGISVIREVFEKLDQRQIDRQSVRVLSPDQTVIDLTTSSAVKLLEEQPKNEVDSWLEENLGG